jgi:hypothetical protein
MTLPMHLGGFVAAVGFALAPQCALRLLRLLILIYALGLGD